ncbi:hypothetical protein [Nonomuraea wenchangensis]|uniref:hypothetical protein n=1 Tax=Nonomuraea wenchangensis TaxID=568860 RepID=UPI0037AA878D
MATAVDLDLAQVRAFVQAAEELHFGHAAEELSILHADHPLADAPAIRPAQLRDGVPGTPGALHRLDFLHRFAMAFGIHQHAAGTNLGLDRFLADLATDRHHFSLLPADTPLPPHPAIRSVPLIDPRPLYAW